MRILFRVLVFGYVFAILQSCASVYLPAAQNVPVFREKGEVKLSAGVYDYQVAYAVGRHTAVMVNAQNSDRLVREIMARPGSNNRVVSKMVEVGGGFFTDDKSTWTFETYGGLGVFKTALRSDFQDTRPVYPGETALRDSSYTTHLNTRGARFFLQPNLGFASKAIDIAFSTRITGLTFGSVTSVNFSAFTLKYSSIGNLGDRLHLFAEPAITMRVGYKWIKMQIQTGISLQFTSAEVPYNYLFGSVGLVGDIGKWYR